MSRNLTLKPFLAGNTRGAAHKEVACPEHIFRAYDIRGHAEKELTDAVIDSIAGAIGTIAGQMGEHALIVGCDGRTSSPRIKAVLIRAIMATGRDVIDIGMTPTPLLYFATRHLNYRSGIMITGSHNPAEQNGLKIVLDRQTLAAGRIAEIRDQAAAGNFSAGNGRITQESIVPAYLDRVRQWRHQQDRAATVSRARLRCYTAKLPGGRSLSWPPPRHQ